MNYKKMNVDFRFLNTGADLIKTSLWNGHFSLTGNIIKITSVRPTLRYLFEYGSLKNSAGSQAYPTHFDLTSGSSDLPDLDIKSPGDYDMIILHNDLSNQKQGEEKVKGAWKPIDPTCK